MERDKNHAYDLAISFLSQDEPLALKLYGAARGESVCICLLEETRGVGRNGWSRILSPGFFSESRLVVVLFRNGWGKTKWTAVEERAIKDRMFETGWDSLLFVIDSGHQERRH